MIVDRLTAVNNFSYTNARVRARRANLITDQEYRKLAKMDLAEIAEFLGKRGYDREMEELGADLSGEDLIETGVRRNLVRTYRELMVMSPDPVQEMLDVYFRKFDVENLKILLRAQQDGADVSDIVVPTRSLDQEALDRLAELDTPEAVIDAADLAGLDGDLQEHVPEDASIAELEDALDTHYYTNIIDRVDEIGGRSELFQRFLETEAALKNVSLVLRMKRRGYAYEDIVDRLIPVTGRGPVDVQELARLETVDEVVNRLEESPVGEYLAGDSPAEIQRGLETYKLKQGIRLMHRDQLGVNPVLGFLVCKEVEATNLQMIARAKEAGLGESFIERNLVEGVAS
ncbi:MAG: V-type ATPase subunit [Candidatus Nanohaloarchaea archaeon]|nr:V-type ATPase subunit [Candidatus Nanohaloarchaea archaeon]